MTRYNFQNDRFLNQLADTICGRGWRIPALIALQAGRPLAFLGGQLLWIAQPALALILPHNEISRLASTLEDPTALDELITHLEARSF